MEKVVVITGAASGLGKGLKQRYLQDGNIVIGIDKNADDGDFVCDISNKEEVKKTFAQIAEKYKKIDVLISCAGYAVFGATELVDVDKAKAMFDVNYFGTLMCVQNALPLMQKGARIFIISSACSLFAVPFRTHYCASKSAVSMLCYGLNMELKSSGIDVVCINPGDVKTNFSKNRVKTFETNERYGDRIEKCSKQIDKRENKRMTVDYVIKKLYKIFNKKHLKPMYIVGSSMKFLFHAKKFVTVNTFLRFTNKYF